MKFTLAWLRDHLDTEAPLADLVEALTDLGLEVESVEDPATRLGAFTVCRVIEARKHPNADTLRVCRVETKPQGPSGPSVEVQVVCGAPNARTGMIGVFAAVGVYVPGTDLLLKAGEIRGQASNGMLVSERELEISDDHDGIIELPDDAPLGARFIDVTGRADPTLHIKITPNRPDACGVRGIARDLAARGLGVLKPETIAPVAGRFPNPVAVTLDAAVRKEADDAPAACPLFVGRLIRGVRNGPSPDWLQRRLRAIGMKPKSALVDITNYVAFDRARPLHVFDAGKLEGAIKVRLAKQGETMLGLDDRLYTLDAGMTVVCDRGGKRVVAIGGVMGGAETGCDADTADVFLESAYFDPIRTARTGRRLEIASDARYRFERGVDPAFTEPGAELATRMILELCGGEPSDLVIAGAVPTKGRNAATRAFTLDAGRLARLVGLDLGADAQAEILTRLGFTVSGRGAKRRVVAPSWRPDVRGEQDLVEEVARVASLTKLVSRPMARPTPGALRPVLTAAQRRASSARRTLAAQGLIECVTYSFVDGASARLFGGGDAARRLENPIAADKSDMRPSPLPGLLAAAARNQARGEPDLALFELGPEFTGGEPGEQREVACALRVGASAPRHWSGERRPVDLYDAKADAEALLAALGVPLDKLQIDRDTPSWWHPGRSGRLKLGPKTVLAEFGALHPRVVAALDVKGPAVAATVFLDAMPAAKAKGRARPALTSHDLQPVERDFAFVVDARVEAKAILDAARNADKKLVVGARVFDVFEGPKAEAALGSGKKSVAIELRLQPTTKTLTDAEIDAVGQAVVAGVTRATGARLRS